MLAFSLIWSYQMNPANYREALIETAADEAEGADILLVIFLLYGGLLWRQFYVCIYNHGPHLTGETGITILGYHPTSSG